jgi:hypothetical protein
MTSDNRLQTATAVNGPDYLRLPLAWTPSRRFEHDRVYEYRMALGDGDVAILRLVADKGWAMTISHGSGHPDTERGLFGMPHDALLVLVAEFAFAGDHVEDLQEEAGAHVLPAEIGE